MKVAYVGDFINHGKSLQTIGTSIVILLSLLESVESIDVYCPKENKDTEEFEFPPKVRLLESYRYEDVKSIFRLLQKPWNKYGAVIFNMLPTGFGNGSLANAAALCIPILLVKIFRLNNIRVIYHNSVFTNDFRTLGYNSPYDKVRSFFLSVVERTLFKNVNSFVLLDVYNKRIDKTIGKNKVHVLKASYLEAITTLYINKKLNVEFLDVETKLIPTVLMHGSWGPQKNIEMGLSALKKVRESGINFRLVISGGINHHFLEYEKKFRELLISYSDIIDEYLGTVEEKDIMRIFLEASLLILPYNTPGGHSGVLEQAIFFQVPTIAIDFPEYREQAAGFENVTLIDPKDLTSELILQELGISPYRTINIGKKIGESEMNLENIVK